MWIRIGPISIRTRIFSSRSVGRLGFVLDPWPTRPRAHERAHEHGAVETRWWVLHRAITRSCSPVQHSSFHLFLLLLPRPRNVCSACIHAVMSKRYSTYLRDVSRMQMSHQGISIGLRILGWFSRTSGKCPRSPPIYSPLCSDGYRW